MKKLLLILLFISTTSSADVMYFLIGQMFWQGQYLCLYSNGVVLSVGMDPCPLHIK